mmetsp:Transcript_3759/g.5615  ORF Transcript_3759/g.5615 Transcript_3759/m.5615 type:complete len:209 (+) Transcript_3759:2009-2635(+)
MANHGPAYGLSAELIQKREAQYDKKLEQKVASWIENVTGERQQGSFQEWLKSGVVLCNLANKIKPGSIRQVKTSRMPFMQMENIGKYLDVVTAAGVKPCDSFMTVDLYEGKNMNQVVLGLAAYARAAQRAGYSGPKLDISGTAPEQVEYASEFGAGKPPAPSAAKYSINKKAPASTTTTPTSGGAKFCSECGTKASGGRFCANCGHQL